MSARARAQALTAVDEVTVLVHADLAAHVEHAARLNGLRVRPNGAGGLRCADHFVARRAAGVLRGEDADGAAKHGRAQHAGVHEVGRHCWMI